MSTRTASAAISLLCLLAPALHAATLDVTVEIPRIDVSEYHRPYVALWIERDDRSVAADLAVWYLDTDTKDGKGAQWLADLRQWWRRSGRLQDMPIDGVTGATRPAGQYQLSFTVGKPPLVELAPGSYQLRAEAVREVGGRELLGIDFTWPPEGLVQLSAQGEHELGTLKLELKP